VYTGVPWCGLCETPGLLCRYTSVNTTFGGGRVVILITLCGI